MAIPAPLEEQENPSFASVADPAQLQRPHCEQCIVAIADYECQRCAQRFCKPCELIIHHRLEELALKHEESKGDGRPHQEFLKWISACQECGEKALEFYCLNCNIYQCEHCCATKHRQLEPHLFFCVEGSSPKMLPFASWNLLFVETVKMKKGDLQDRAAASMAAHIKLEEVGTASSTGATAAALRNLTINGSDLKGASQPAVQPQKSHPQHVSRASTTSFVDLTLDDGSDTGASRSCSQPSSHPRIKEETQVNTEASWLTSITAPQEELMLDVDDLMDKTMGEEEDPLLRSMISEYNQLSAGIFDIDQEVDSIRRKTKELSSTQPIDMVAVSNTRVKANQLRKVKTDLEKSRDGVVAKVVFYLKSDPEELKAFLETCTAEVSYAQTACHRKCATLEANIRQNLERIGKIQRDMEELINMKKDAFAEVTRLGAEIAQGEEEVRKLDKERQDEFLRLCQYSKAIQVAVQEMAASAL